MRKVNILIIYYKALGQLHEILKKEIKVNVRKEIKSRMRGRWTLLKKLNRNHKLIKLNKRKNLFILEFLYLWNLMRKLIIIGNPNSKHF